MSESDYIEVLEKLDYDPETGLFSQKWFNEDGRMIMSQTCNSRTGQRDASFPSCVNLGPITMPKSSEPPRE